MKQPKIILSIFLLLIFACKKDVQFTNRESIVPYKNPCDSVFPSSESCRWDTVPVLQQEFLSWCIDRLKDTCINSTTIVNNQQEYEALLLCMPQTAYCDCYTLPPIDFNTTTLLGNYLWLGFIPNVVHRDVTKCNTQMTYRYKVSINQNYGGALVWYSMNFIAIPKIEECYTVEFETEVN